MSDLEGVRARLVEVRGELGYRKFAKALKERGGLTVSHVTVSNYEKDPGDPPASYLLAVCRAFGKDPGWLLWGVDQVGVGDRLALIQRLADPSLSVPDEDLHELLDATRPHGGKAAAGGGGGGAKGS